MFSALTNAPMSAWIAIILAGLFIAFGLACALANEVVRFAAEKLAEDALCDGADGDWPHVPSDLKAFHSAANDTGAQRDHA